MHFGIGRFMSGIIRNIYIRSVRNISRRAIVDLSHLLCAISEASPCGDDLEYDPQLLELQRAAEGQPERQMGEAVLAAEPPDWRKARELAGALFARGKDLRIAHYLVRSALALDGLPGLAEGLTLVRELLGRYWDELYPRPDHEDGDDPTLRLNSLAELAGEPLLHLLRDRGREKINRGQQHQAFVVSGSRSIIDRRPEKNRKHWKIKHWNSQK